MGCCDVVLVELHRVARLEFSGSRVKPRTVKMVGPKAAGLHTTAREPKRAHFRVPALQKHHQKFHEKTPREIKRANMGAGEEKKKKREFFWAPHPRLEFSGLPTTSWSSPCTLVLLHRNQPVLSVRLLQQLLQYLATRCCFQPVCGLASVRYSFVFFSRCEKRKNVHRLSQTGTKPLKHTAPH